MRTQIDRIDSRFAPHLVAGLALGLALFAGCAGTTPAAGGDGSAGKKDMTVCVGAACTGGCDVDGDCSGGKKCDVTSHTCVICRTDADCAPGDVCSAVSHTCATGCAADHGCGDAGLCEPDAGMCVACLGDSDCNDPNNPRCNPANHSCTACLPTADNCGLGLYCAQAGNGYACTSGCKTDDDCTASTDGGTGTDDGGAGDGGSAGDGGTPITAASARCDTTVHQCVRCVADSDCALGKLCKGDHCVDGCSDQHGCPQSLTCCDAACVDVTTNSQNCGMCDNACQGGWNCCNSACSNPVTDLNNCGMCGTACAVKNGTPSCSLRACAIASCDPGYADCNGVAMDGCETHTDVNVNNCGACNNACSLPHAQPKCSGGMCGIDSCIFPWADCNGIAADGCELNTQGSDVNNCGGCGTVCNLPNATPLCNKGVCQISACQNGWADCNGDPTDGCEVDTTSTITSCGVCNRVCTLSNATPVCTQGACLIQTCNPGYADCDGLAINGCEVNTQNGDPQNCGACKAACSSTNGVPSCVAGGCLIACTSGYADCDKDPTNGCEVNTNLSTDNCGTCGNKCSTPNATAGCTAGACVVSTCNAGYADCNNQPKDGCEINTAVDTSNCGACGKVCSTTNGKAACAAGACSIGCNAGYADCDANVTNGCEVNLGTDANNCGTCGKVCSLPHATAGCSVGACVIAKCDTGYADCDGNPANGCEVNLTVDAVNCGTCMRMCSNNNGTPSCNNGTCAITCSAGFADCNANASDGCEVNLNNDVNNCNGCGRACSSVNGSPACQGGSCQITCTAGWGNCDGNVANGCETNTTNNVANCGQCNSACQLANATPSCVNSACAVATCSAGYSDCDGNAANGCEDHTAIDTANCGSCGHACSSNNGTAGCANGTCSISCTPGFADCNANAADGCEVNLTNDVNNCNGCNKACDRTNGTASCSGSTCQIACNAGWGNCDGSAANGCETNTNTSTANCGSCGNACALAHTATDNCVGGSCTVASCSTGYGDCNGVAADGCEDNLTNDVNNCGSCGDVCMLPHATPSCSNSACVVGSCNAGWADCNGNPADGCEVNLNGDPNNCNSCGHVCNSINGIAGCQGGACQITCNSGWGNCDGNELNGCETNTNTNTSNCGSCGFVCALANASDSCSGGSCTVSGCSSGYANCDGAPANGCEINTTNDVNNCNGCGVACSLPNATPACTNSACTISSCNTGYADCDRSPADGCEVNIQSGDPNDCGGCKMTCSTNNIATPACTGGACTGTCNPGFADCDNTKRANGCHFNLSNDDANCGACGNACANVCVGQVATTNCGAGTCAVTACNAGYFDVDGACADGCECAAPSLNTCGNPIDLGQMGWGGDSTYSAVIPAGSGAVWYTLNFANSGTAYHPHIEINGANYVFDVFQGCGGATIGCQDSGGQSSGIANWEVVNNGNYPLWPTPTPGQQIFIQVRATGNTACNAFTLTVFNNGN